MKILITYATKYGAAEKCAHSIAEKLNGECDLVNLKKEQPRALSSYDKIIIGGSVYASNIQKEVKDFCEQNTALLLSKPLGLFLSCMGLNQQELTSNFKFSFSDELMEHATVADALGGVFDYNKMGFLEKQVIKIVGRRLKKQGRADIVLDGKTNFSSISPERIEVFAEYMNKAL